MILCLSGPTYVMFDCNACALQAISQKIISEFKLTVRMNGLWVEEGPRLSAAPVRSALRVLTPDPIELLVQTNVNLVEQRGVEILVMGAIDSWKAGIGIHSSSSLRVTAFQLNWF